MTDRQIDLRIRRVIELKIAKKELEAEIERLQAEIKASMGDEQTLETGKYFIRNTEFERRTVDSQKLKTEHPRIYLECSAVSVCRRFSYTEK
jgi:predicted phage-related endonuclease